jgi:hypothetical protein
LGDDVLSPPTRLPLPPIITFGYRLLGDFEVAITGGIWVAAGVTPEFQKSFFTMSTISEMLAEFVKAMR